MAFASRNMKFLPQVPALASLSDELPIMFKLSESFLVKVASCHLFHSRNIHETTRRAWLSEGAMRGGTRQGTQRQGRR